jgi:uncharacterized protein (TIGR01777 family)
VLISASAVGIYGDRGDEILTDTSPPGNPAEDFLVSVCLEWEAAASPARDAGIRVVHPRFGLVLSPAGGALKKLLPIFRLGLGGKLGSGDQWMSWISIEDTVGAIRHLLNHDAVNGPVNVTAPEPVTNRDLAASLGRVLGRPALLPAPGLALRLALGEMADTTLLAGSRVLPARLLQSGYRFAHRDLESALKQMLRGARSSSFPA